MNNILLQKKGGAGDEKHTFSGKKSLSINVYQFFVCNGSKPRCVAIFSKKSLAFFVFQYSALQILFQ
jgi:hypothetical protein